MGGGRDARRRAGRSRVGPADRRVVRGAAEGGSRPEELCGVAEGVQRLAGERAEAGSAPARGTEADGGGGRVERDFRIRVRNAQREARDAELDDIRKTFAEKRARREEALRRAEQGVQREQDQASRRSCRRRVSFGATVLGALFGRKTLSATNLGRATTAMRGAGRASKEPRTSSERRGTSTPRRRRSTISTRRSRRRPPHRRRATTPTLDTSTRSRSPRSAARFSCSRRASGGGQLTANSCPASASGFQLPTPGCPASGFELPAVNRRVAGSNPARGASSIRSIKSTTANRAVRCSRKSHSLSDL